MGMGDHQTGCYDFCFLVRFYIWNQKRKTDQRLSVFLLDACRVYSMVLYEQHADGRRRVDPEIPVSGYADQVSCRYDPDLCQHVSVICKYLSAARNDPDFYIVWGQTDDILSGAAVL